MSTTSSLTFSESPSLSIASNVFTNVPVVVLYDETPLVELVKEADASFTTKISVLEPNGKCIAVVKGTQLYDTDDTSAAGLALRYPGKRTICHRNGHELFSLQRTHAAALRLRATLQTPNGIFIRTKARIKMSDFELSDALVIQFPTGLLLALKDFDVRDGEVGIHLRSDGSVKIGTNCAIQQSWKGPLPASLPPDVLVLVMEQGGPVSNLTVKKLDPRSVVRWNGSA